MYILRVVLLLIVVLIVFILLSGIFVQANDVEKKKAASVSDEWLKLIDDGHYGESWENSARLFQNAINKNQWEQTLLAHRKPFGKVVRRKLKSMEYTKSLPGAPDGEYVVIQYETTFENKKPAVETVTPMKDSDGRWRVSGYYVK